VKKNKGQKTEGSVYNMRSLFFVSGGEVQFLEVARRAMNSSYNMLQRPGNLSYLWMHPVFYFRVKKKLDEIEHSLSFFKNKIGGQENLYYS
jgi:hypothetical protein